MPAMTDTKGEDPLVGFAFAFEVQGKITGYFTEVDGLGSETEVVEQKYVNQKGVEVIRKVPGRLSWQEITLKRGITSNLDLWKWRKEVEDGKVKGARKNGSVTMFDQGGAVVAQWDFQQAWPSKVSGPSVSSESGDVGVEELTIVHEYIERTK